VGPLPSSHAPLRDDVGDVDGGVVRARRDIDARGFVCASSSRATT